MSKLLVKRIIPNAKLPTKGSELAAGYDLYTPETVIVPAHESVMIKIGIAVRVPHGTYGRIAPRSGLALKGLDVAAGVIDEDYCSDLGVILRNTSNTDIQLDSGSRIAQLILEVIISDAVIEDVQDLPETKRGNGGFGSTGK